MFNMVKKQRETALQREIARLSKLVRRGPGGSIKDRLVPRKADSKPVGYKMQNTFEENLKGVPGTSMSRGVTFSLVQQIQAKTTGTRVVKPEDVPGWMKSMRNCNTTQGSYNQTILTDQLGDTVSDVQGRRR